MTNDNTQNIDDLLELFLIEALPQIIEAYQEFLSKTNIEKEDLDKFLEFHKACKMATANIEQLLKLQKSYAPESEVKALTPALIDSLSLACSKVKENYENKNL